MSLLSAKEEITHTFNDALQKVKEHPGWGKYLDDLRQAAEAGNHTDFYNLVSVGELLRRGFPLDGQLDWSISVNSTPGTPDSPGPTFPGPGPSVPSVDIPSLATSTIPEIPDDIDVSGLDDTFRPRVELPDDRFYPPQPPPQIENPIPIEIAEPGTLPDPIEIPEYDPSLFADGGTSGEVSASVKIGPVEIQ